MSEIRLACLAVAMAFLMAFGISCTDGRNCPDVSTNAASQPAGAAYDEDAPVTIVRNSLSVSADGKLATFMSCRESVSNAFPAEITAWLLRPDGSMTNIATMLPKRNGQPPLVDDVRLSADGLFMFVEAILDDKGQLFLVKLADSSVQIVVDGKENVEGVWAGDNVVYSFATDGRVDTLRMFPAAKGPSASRELPLAGIAVSANSSGDYLVIGADPQNPRKPLDRDSFMDSASAMVVNLEGKVLMDLVEVRSSSPYISISPDGKTIAYAYKNAESLMTEIRVVEVHGKELFSVGISMTIGRPVAMLNGGILIASDQDPLTPENGVRICQMDAAGKRFVVAEKIGDATVVGDTLYTISYPRHPELNAIKLPVTSDARAQSKPAVR